MVGFGAQAVLKTRPNAAQWMSRFSGCAMVVIAISLVVEQLSG